MTYSIDSSALIHLFINSEQGRKIARIIEKEKIVISGVVYCETLNINRIDGNNFAKKFFENNLITDLKINDFIDAGELIINQRKKGFQISTSDALIAITAIKQKANLITTDSDFQTIEQLELILIT